jgi:hypothetical protein
VIGDTFGVPDGHGSAGLGLCVFWDDDAGPLEGPASLGGFSVTMTASEFEALLVSPGPVPGASS